MIEPANESRWTVQMDLCFPSWQGMISILLPQQRKWHIFDQHFQERKTYSTYKPTLYTHTPAHGVNKKTVRIMKTEELQVKFEVSLFPSDFFVLPPSPPSFDCAGKKFIQNHQSLNSSSWQFRRNLRCVPVTLVRHTKTPDLNDFYKMSPLCAKTKHNCHQNSSFRTSHPSSERLRPTKLSKKLEWSTVLVELVIFNSYLNQSYFWQRLNWIVLATHLVNTVLCWTGFFF